MIWLQYHPDVCKGSNCGVQFHRINEAYDVSINHKFTIFCLVILLGILNERLNVYVCVFVCEYVCRLWWRVWGRQKKKRKQNRTHGVMKMMIKWEGCMTPVGICGKSGWDGKVLAFWTTLLISTLTFNNLIYCVIKYNENMMRKHLMFVCMIVNTTSTFLLSHGMPHIEIKFSIWK